MTDLRDNLYLEIEAERHRQEKLWGIQHHGRFEWMNILLEEVGEAAQAANDMDMKGFRKEIVECAAVCMAILEDNQDDFEPRFWDAGKQMWAKVSR